MELTNPGQREPAHRVPPLPISPAHIPKPPPKAPRRTGQEEAEQFRDAVLAWWDAIYHAFIRPEAYRRVNPRPEDET